MKLKRNNKGLTLIEVIIAIAILGLLATAFLSVFSQGVGTIFMMGNKTDATRIAQEYMDQYIADPEKGEITNQTVGKNYTLASRIDDFNIDGRDEPMRKITITVFYRDGSRNIDITAVVP